jgi:hypothetical protein
MADEEEKAHRIIHKQMSDQELQDLHERARNATVDKQNAFAQREEQLLREEMARRGIQPKTRPDA